MHTYIHILGAIVRQRDSISTVTTAAAYATTPTDGWEIDPAELELGQELGQGAFGRVITGFYKKKRVAIKVLKESIPDLYREDLLREIALLKSIGIHPCIVSMLGASTVKEPIALVMEYMPYGNLLEFLRFNRELVCIHCMTDPMTNQKEVWEITSKCLISWVRQIAVAMEYLSSKQYVHRDLAARNILLGINKSVKLCDFGLARLIFHGDPHYFRRTNGRLPFKWMALESIKDRLYTSKSDVWSFGILLWEIATFGAAPYPNIPVGELYRYLGEGYRMPQPYNCSEELYQLMYSCWSTSPDDRPTFSDLRCKLETMLTKDVEYLDLDLANFQASFLACDGRDDKDGVELHKESFIEDNNVFEGLNLESV
ncbi:hypothetical protein HELRODRAFT_87050 [Helobdella robusta]|uniref:Protein kinase domain-containing protein n=1 Tax=Helobdella robusta TaxID=6412 RepID=T1G6L0_HELRO|nr:hypothetical protein HELRODRAFT_87050 [Helobdella robusta]ESN95228.1 hypothetical protein HELRODRAFT_87050 [Helobdella robusta]